MTQKEILSNKLTKLEANREYLGEHIKELDSQIKSVKEQLEKLKIYECKNTPRKEVWSVSQYFKSDSEGYSKGYYLQTIDLENSSYDWSGIKNPREVLYEALGVKLACQVADLAEIEFEPDEEATMYFEVEWGNEKATITRNFE